jgi:fructosamine-3-kinase
MWQSKIEISRECNDIIGSAKGSQISEKYWGEVGKEKRVDVYLEVRKRRGHIFLNETSACAMNPNKKPTFSKPILFID